LSIFFKLPNLLKKIGHQGESLVTGELENRTRTAATAFKPELWTYAAASPTLKARGDAITVDIDRLVWGFYAPGSAVG
jgi:hypothetical protein